MPYLTPKVPMSFRSFLDRYPLPLLLIALAVWGALYSQLEPAAHALASLLPLSEGSHAREAVSFFLYDVPKIFLLLAGITFVMGIINSFITPEKTRRFLAGRREGVSNVLAAILGIFTPFCSCSAVPLFVGFVQANIPLGVTFSFLIAAPMINEVALALLFGLFGWKVALLYLSMGLAVAIVAGWVLGRLKLEKHLAEWVKYLHKYQEETKETAPTWGERLATGWHMTRTVVGKVWLFILLGVAVGAGIHGYVPTDAMAAIMGKEAWWSVPLAVLIGVPMYANAAGVLPIVQALIAKGAALGTALAFMMSVVALSLPEMIILRQVLSWRLIAIFVSVVASGILLVGFVFNAVL